jgi:hypothetical protein
MMSALRFAWTTQGVTQAVGMSSPEISAVAPAGVVEMEIFSVVPRVTDAQPRRGNAIAAAKNSLDHWIVFPRPMELSCSLRMKARGCSRPMTNVEVFCASDRVGIPPNADGHRPPSPFKLIRGIVRVTDSLRPVRAQHMKKHAQTIESYD